MGVIKLMNFIESKCPSVINHCSPLHFKNKTLAIDSPSAIYKFLIKTISTSFLIKRAQVLKSTYRWILKVTKLVISLESCIVHYFVCKLGSNQSGFLMENHLHKN